MARTAASWRGPIAGLAVLLLLQHAWAARVLHQVELVPDVTEGVDTAGDAVSYGHALVSSKCNVGKGLDKWGEDSACLLEDGGSLPVHIPLGAWEGVA